MKNTAMFSWGIAPLLVVVQYGAATLWRASLSEYPNAVCNDGTEGVYYHSLDDGPEQNFILYLQGGGYCHNLELCDLRCEINPNLCTTRDDLTKGNNGILSDFETENPLFYDYYKVELHYCSSDLYIGNRSAEPESGNYHFRGRDIVSAMIRSLDENVGISRAQNVILTGSSAGGAGTVFLCNELQQMLPSVNVSCIPDAAFYYPNIPLFTPGCEGPNGMVRTGSRLWHGNQDDFDVHTWWHSIQRPLFIGSAMYELFGMGLYCTDLTNDTHIEQWGQGALVQNRGIVENYPHIGLWTPSCFAHSMINSNDWFHDPGAGPDDLTYAGTIRNWFQGEGSIHVWDECPDLPDCNNQCVDQKRGSINSPPL